MLKRLQHAIDAGRRAAASDTTGSSLRDIRVSWALIHLDDETGPGDHIAPHLEFCQSAGYRCLVISNRFDPVILTKEAVTFEFAPLDIRAAHDSGQDARLATRYLLDRLSHTVSFWNVVGCTWSGTRSADVRRAATADAPRLAAMARRPPKKLP